MEFMNRGGRPNQPAAPAPSSSVATPTNHAGTRKKGVKDILGLKVAQLVVMVSLAIILVALVWLTVRRTPVSESENVNRNQIQAVFMNGLSGDQIQLYFGRIQEINDTYLRLSDIYYLRVNQQVQPDEQKQATANDISLMKLGCELHGPEDEMVINRTQVAFWENLKSDGDVAKAVAEYRKQNPNGPDCEAQKKAAQEQAEESNN